jgi:hypothetical protein
MLTVLIFVICNLPRIIFNMPEITVLDIRVNAGKSLTFHHPPSNCPHLCVSSSLCVIIFVICNLLRIILIMHEISVMDIMKSVGHHELSRFVLILGSNAVTPPRAVARGFSA